MTTAETNTPSPVKRAGIFFVLGVLIVGFMIFSLKYGPLVLQALIHNFTEYLLACFLSALLLSFSIGIVILLLSPFKKYRSKAMRCRAVTSLSTFYVVAATLVAMTQ